MIPIAFVAAAAFGALLRADLGRRLNAPGGFPLGTLLVNCTGSFAIGLLVGSTTETFTIFGVGCIGAYTTVSSFARDGVALLEAREWRLACVYLCASLMLPTALAYLAISI